MQELNPKPEHNESTPSEPAQSERPVSLTLLDEMRNSERIQLSKLLPSTYYPTAVQLGGAATDHLETLSCGVKIQLFDNIAQRDELLNPVLVDYAAVPLPARTVDLAVLPHVLEQVKDPIPVLREISQIISANGIIAVTGFNPMSLYGVKSLSARTLRRFRKPRADSQSTVRLHRMGQIQDWLSLLNFELRAASVFYYKPPLPQSRLRARFEHLEKAGARWWPAAGSIYVLVARKREVGARLLPVRKHKVVDLKPRLAKPLSRYKPSVSRFTDDSPD